MSTAKCDHVEFILLGVLGEIGGARCYSCGENFYFYLSSHDDTWAYAADGFVKIPTFEELKVDRKESFEYAMRHSH